MKIKIQNALHRIAIAHGLYRVVYTGAMDIGKTWFGVYFIVGHYAPKALDQCIDDLVSYQDELWDKNFA
jgi:hypothetical protein